MSMISAQINELRKWADQLSERENEFGVVVRALVAALRNAADTIWQLRNDLQRVNAENAKLRELVRDLWLTGSLCDAIPDMRLQAKGGDWRTMQERVDEALGIEVDDD